MKHDDLTIVIQGPANRLGKIGKGILNIPSYKKYTDNIIISTWINPEVKPSKRFLEKNGVIYIEDDPEKYSSFLKFNNVHLQAATSLNGMKVVKTKYAIKVRTDESYSDLNIFIDTMKSNEELLITSEPFYRRPLLKRYDEEYAYSMISDHVMGGKTKKIRKMFSTTSKKCRTHKIPQITTFRGVQYCPEDLLRDCFQGEFKIVHMEDLGRFWCKVGNARITNKTYKNYENYGTEIKP
jgi:hypothetical protein